jgi:hypothetical protein
VFPRGLSARGLGSGYASAASFCSTDLTGPFFLRSFTYHR